MAIASGSSQKRKVKSDPVKILRSSLGFTQGGLQPSAIQAVCSKLSLLAPEEDRPPHTKGLSPEPPRWGLSA